jgi:hypothetical protein
MRRYPIPGKGRISEALHVEHTMIQNRLLLHAARVAAQALPS